jgi:hypothetical protein
VAGVTPQAIALYTLLLAHTHRAAGDGLAWPGLDVLADLLGYNRRQSVTPYVKELEARGAIDVHRRQRGPNGWLTEYVIHELPPADHTGPVDLVDYHRTRRRERVLARSERVTERVCETLPERVSDTLTPTLADTLDTTPPDVQEHRNPQATGGGAVQRTMGGAVHRTRTRGREPEEVTAAPPPDARTRAPRARPPARPDRGPGPHRTGDDNPAPTAPAVRVHRARNWARLTTRQRVRHLVRATAAILVSNHHAPAPGGLDVLARALIADHDHDPRTDLVATTEALICEAFTGDPGCAWLLAHPPARDPDPEHGELHDHRPDATWSTR